MMKKGPAEPPKAACKHRRVRLSPETREQAIVDGAITYFAANGFGGQTRELAAELGISQGLIFRYFPTKEDLIERVYSEVFDKEWMPDIDLLTKPNVPLSERMTSFYRSYARLILGQDYTRLLLFAALSGVNFHERLFIKIGAEIYPVLIEELRCHFGRPPISEIDPTQVEIEAIWGLHAGIFYLGIREHVFGLDVPQIDTAIELKVNTFLQGVSAALP